LSSILVSGLINIETTLRVDGFPILYDPVRYPFYGVNSSASGVGYNIARALTVLGDSVNLLSIIGRDEAGELARCVLKDAGLSGEGVLSLIEHTAQSVILYDSDGRRQINVDLKDIQEARYPEKQFVQAIDRASLVVLCNINFSRPFLSVARQVGKTIATDVHALSELEDPYNRDFMAAAQVLFMSDERLPEPPGDFARRVADRYRPEVIVVGLGSHGALLYLREDDSLEQVPAVQVRPVVSTIGAGDALFSCFVHYYAGGLAPAAALRKAVVFAGYKIGEAGAADGFLDEAGLDELLLLAR
jgi:acarbose 7IV-phosphotransferase